MAMLNMLHACLRVENLEKSIEFYEKAFGFKEDRRKDFPEHKFTIVYLTLPIASDDLEGDNEKHKAMGYKTTDLMGLPGNPGHYYFVTDPDGYRMEVIRAE